jgi:hypothetical protein
MDELRHRSVFPTRQEIEQRLCGKLVVALAVSGKGSGKGFQIYGSPKENNSSGRGAIKSYITGAKNLNYKEEDILVLGEV